MKKTLEEKLKMCNKITFLSRVSLVKRSLK